MMNPKQRLLFLYMVPHTGHQKAAEAIMEAASIMDPHMETTAIDAVSHAYPILGNVFNRMYLQMLKRAPMVWDFLYDNPDVEEVTRDARGLLTLISSFKANNIIKKFHPLAVVCTQALPATVMAAQKKKGHLKVPLVGIITDFGVHTYWLHKEIDLYLVAHVEIKKELILRGQIPPEKIHVSGIPVSPSFGDTEPKREARKKLKISPNKKTILLMGGSGGFGSLDEMVKILKSLQVPFQTLVVCGNNKKILRKIQKSTQGDSQFIPMGYVRNLPTLMSASDLLISKPGGLTCSEALAKGLPMILTYPIPGQETRNAKFLVRHKVARLAQSEPEIKKSVKELLQFPRKLHQMRTAAESIAEPHSAWEAARLIFDLINLRGPFANEPESSS
jgi:processive 1,2-diacylglycerol beta-glucosyltransferase